MFISLLDPTVSTNRVRKQTVMRVLTEDQVSDFVEGTSQMATPLNTRVQLQPKAFIAKSTAKAS